MLKWSDYSWHTVWWQLKRVLMWKDAFEFLLHASSLGILACYVLHVILSFPNCPMALPLSKQCNTPSAHIPLVSSAQPIIERHLIFLFFSYIRLLHAKTFFGGCWGEAKQSRWEGSFCQLQHIQLMLIVSKSSFLYQRVAWPSGWYICPSTWQYNHPSGSEKMYCCLYSIHRCWHQLEGGYITDSGSMMILRDLIVGILYCTDNEWIVGEQKQQQCVAWNMPWMWKGMHTIC